MGCPGEAVEAWGTSPATEPLPAFPRALWADAAAANSHPEEAPGIEDRSRSDPWLNNKPQPAGRKGYQLGLKGPQTTVTPQQVEGEPKLPAQGLRLSSPSLARQWTLEDEEEQERERRRRHRHLSSTTEDEVPRLTQNGDQQAAERLPSVEETEVPKPLPSAPKDEEDDIQVILRARQERRQRRKAVEAVPAPMQEGLEAEDVRDSSSPDPAMQQPLTPKKEPQALPRRRLSREKRGPWAQEEERLVSKEPGMGKKGLPEEAPAPEETLVSEKSSVPEKTPTKRLALEKTCLSEKGPAPESTAVSQKTAVLDTGSPEKSAPGKSSIFETSLAPEKASVSEKTAVLEKRSMLDKKTDLGKVSVSEKPPGKASSRVSEKASFFEKSSVTETKLAPKKVAASEQPQGSGGGQASTQERGGRAVSRRSPTSSAAERRVPGSPAAASRLPPITLQVKIPSKEEEEEEGTSSPSQLTYSTSLKRSSPRTISFRMSPRKDNSETTLTRSASVRLPASTVKLEEKLERYHKAVQRSESVRSQGSSRTEVFVAPTGVASKRHLFEKELVDQSQAEPVSSRKDNLKLSGVVTSRLNLWISRTQESGDQDPQEVQKQLAAAKRTQWAKKSESFLDVEV
nr:ladinin-1 [Cavia porcellus]